MLLRRYGELHSSTDASLALQTLNGIFMVLLTHARRDRLPFFKNHAGVKMYEMMMDGTFPVLLSAMSHPQLIGAAAMKSLKAVPKASTHLERPNKRQKTESVPRWDEVLLYNSENLALIHCSRVNGATVYYRSYWKNFGTEKYPAIS